MNRRINKTVAAFLATMAGGIGTHRFYMYGRKDFWGWVYFAAFLLYLGLVLSRLPETSFWNNYFALFPLSVYVGLIESLTIGLTADAKWDSRHNPGTRIPTKSTWPLAVLLVSTLLTVYTAFVTSIARASDLLYTAGSFG